MTEIRKEMQKAIRDQTFNLARARRIPESEAADIVARSFRQNLADSRGTLQEIEDEAKGPMESYWKLMIEVADDEVAAQLGMVGR